MKKIFYTFGLILFANIGYSQFLPTGTSTTDNKYRSGSLGIGYTSAPDFVPQTGYGSIYKFMVNGGTKIQGGLHIFPEDGIPQFVVKGDSNYNTSEFQIGVAGGDYHWSNQSKKGDVVLRARTKGSFIITSEGKGGIEAKGDIKFVTQENYQSSKVAMLIDIAGKVGIGENISTIPTTAGGQSVVNYRLFVKGGILSEEVRIMLSSQWADYVFEKDYDLPKLEEVEAFINENKHLPNVPSAKEVADSGIELGEMTKIQQEKIEELTLYIIEQNKVNKKQQEEIDELKEQVKFLLESKK